MLKIVVKQGRINSVGVSSLCHQTHHAIGLANKNVSSKRKGNVELRQLLNRDALTQLELVVCVIRLITPLDWRRKMCRLKGRAMLNA